MNKLLGKKDHPQTFEGGAFTITSVPLNQVDAFFEQMSEKTRAWTARAARGECGWICADCCCTFPDGMPDQCEHWHQGCTDIIKRDKLQRKLPTE